MKTLKSIMICTALLFAMSCSLDDSNPVDMSPTEQVQAISDIAESGSWVVAYYYDTDHEETDHFNNFVFTFDPNGTVSATDGTNTYSGIWSVVADSSDDDYSDVDFNLFFQSPADFNEISDDWDVQSYTQNRIELVDISGGNGGTDFLTFQRL